MLDSTSHVDASDWATRSAYWLAESEPKNTRKRRQREEHPLILTGHGLSLRVEKGSLLVRDGKPIAPYDSDPRRAIPNAFDRVTGESVDPEQLKTCAEALVQYHLSCEDKFVNGQFLDRGRTERRHVVATGVELIGKEANCVGESGEADPVSSAVEVFAELANTLASGKKSTM
jgi:hypothetical protein